ncbi:BTB domain-containing protein [Pleurotus pulmonarius]
MTGSSSAAPNIDENEPSGSSSYMPSRRRSTGQDTPVSNKRARLDHNPVSQFGVTSGTIGQALASFLPAASSSFPETSKNSPTVIYGMDGLSTMQRPLDSQPERAYKRDPTYYMEDGSCILAVEDTLFNVHRSILARDNSSFGTMFTLPQGNNVSEGRSDANPIALVGETVQEFRHFLWALYALPHELRIVTSPGADLNQLIAIARVANKYSFKSIETWSLDAIQEYVTRKPSPILNAIPNPSSYMFLPHSADSSAPDSPLTATNLEYTAQLTRLIKLAQLCSHERLLNTMITLLKQLMSSSLQYAYLAMTLSDELGLRALKGPAYLEVMNKAVLANEIGVALPMRPKSTTHSDVEISETSETGGDNGGQLVISPAQRLRLLSGYYRLSSLWEGLRSCPPSFDHATTCGATWHQQGCSQSWLEFWKEKTRTDAVLAISLADILGRLRQVQKEFDRWGSATYMHHECRMTARRSIQDLVKDLSLFNIYLRLPLLTILPLRLFKND